MEISVKYNYLAYLKLFCLKEDSKASGRALKKKPTCKMRQCNDETEFPAL